MVHQSSELSESTPNVKIGLVQAREFFAFNYPTCHMLNVANNNEHEEYIIYNVNTTFGKLWTFKLYRFKSIKSVTI